jgi:hypothetical protein
MQFRVQAALHEKSSSLVSRVLAPEEQHVYSPSFLIYPAPLGAECNLDAQIDIGRPSLAFPVTPPCIRVRTRRFGELSF